MRGRRGQRDNAALTGDELAEERGGVAEGSASSRWWGWWWWWLRAGDSEVVGFNSGKQALAPRDVGMQTLSSGLDVSAKER